MRGRVLCPSARWGRGTLCAKEAVMEEHSLTFGAHLLLWFFPLVLIIVVITENFLGGRSKGDHR
jgi:hypothetical protein